MMSEKALTMADLIEIVKYSPDELEREIAWRILKKHGIKIS